jgi:predicted metal-dependent phosphoesterase TrpH
LKLKLDLHIHTVHSPDSFNTLQDITRRLKEEGLDGYAVADHDTLTGIPEALKNSEGLAVVPAVEVTARGAHILALQPTEPIPMGRTIAETVDAIHGQGATAVLAHPYGLPRTWISINSAIDARLDAVEVANSAQIPYNYIRDLNEALADRLGLPQTGGSDSHIPDTIGRAYTIVETASRDPEDIVKSIHGGLTTVHGSGITLTERISKTLRKKGKKES